MTSVRVNTDANVLGKVTDEGDGDNFVVDGTTYKYNYTMNNAEKLETDNVNNGVVAYLDAQGYVAYIDESAVTYDYAYVLSMGTDSDKYGKGANDKGTTVYARLVLTDGTMVSVETDNKKSEIGAYDSAKDEYTAKNSTASDKYLLNHIVSYSKDKNGVYSLTDRSGEAIELVGATLDVNNDKASFQAGGPYVANANTVFIVADPDPDSYNDYDFTVYTGVKNVPDIDGNSNTKAVVAVRDTANSNVAKVVYIEDADVSGNGEVIFARADTNPKYTKDQDGKVYEIKAYVDGSATTLKVREGSSAAKALVTKIDTDHALKLSSTKYLVALKSVTTNSDGYVTSVRLYDENALTGDKSGVLIGTGITDKSKDDIVTLTKPNGDSSNYSYTWTDKVVVAQFNDKNNKNEFNSSKMSSIKQDNNDMYIAVLDEGVITGICTVYVEGTDSGNVPVNPNVTVVIGAGNVITVETKDKVLTTPEKLEAIVDHLKNLGLAVNTPYLSDGKYVFNTFYDLGNGMKIPAQTYTFDPENAGAQKITVKINGKDVSVANGTKISDLDTLDKTGYGNYLDDKGTSVNNSDRVLKSGDVIDLYGKVTRNGEDQYGKIGSAVALNGNWYNEGKTSYKAVSGANVTYTVADQTINDGFYKVQIDSENPQYYTATDPHKFTALSSTGTGFIVSEDGGKTWTYVAGKELTTSNKDLEIKKDYVKVSYTTSGEINGYKWTIEAGDTYAKASDKLTVNYTVTGLVNGDSMTVTFDNSLGTDSFTAIGSTMNRPMTFNVGTTDITVTISNIAK